jgi:hypothetical protein
VGSLRLARQTRKMYAAIAPISRPPTPEAIEAVSVNGNRLLAVGLYQGLNVKRIGLVLIYLVDDIARQSDVVPSPL